MRGQPRQGRQAPNRTVLALILLSCCVSLAEAQLELADLFTEVGTFSTAAPGNALPEGWKPLIFKNIDRYTVYKLVEDQEEEKTVVQAVSDGGASGITREITIDPKKYPLIEWRWKVTNVLRQADITKKEGDDYPARIYITFAYESGQVGILDKAKFEALRWWYGHYPPLAAINYVWGSKASVGTMVPNAYTDQVVMFVVQSGPEHLDTWLREERNVYEDYLKAFGKKPPMISGVAIMTDTDDTKEMARTYYGDIIFRQDVSE